MSELTRSIDHTSIITETTGDPLNDPFAVATSIDELSSLYLTQSDLFYLDNASGGQRERQEQFLKFIITLLAPKED